MGDVMSEPPKGPNQRQDGLNRLRVGPMKSRILGAMGEGRITSITEEGVDLILGLPGRSPRGCVFIREPEQLALIEQHPDDEVTK